MSTSVEASPDTAPSVFEAVANVMRDITNLSKESENKHFGFKFRGIDALLGALAQPLRKHGVFIAPRVKSVTSEVIGKNMRTVVEMEYDVYGPRGDHFTVSFPGEAADAGDKSVGKATSYAFKMLCFQLFAIPIDADSVDDPDGTSPQLDHSAGRFATQERNGNGQRRQQKGVRTAQQIAEEALQATSVAQVIRLANEAGPGGRQVEVRDPNGEGEPMKLGDLLTHLKQKLAAA